MSAFAFLIACLFAGMLIAHFTRVPPRLTRALNFWILRVALPALILRLVAQLSWDPHLWYLVAAMWIVLAGAWAIAAFAGSRLGWSRARIGAVVMAAGFGNTAFTGYPLIRALRGEGALPYAAVADQLGCFLALTTAGVAIAAWYGGHRTDVRGIVRRIVLFPPFIACLVGAGVGIYGAWPAAALRIFELLGLTLTPLALLSIGLSFRFDFDRGQVGAVAVALGWKLLAAPLLVWTLGVMAGASGTLLVVAVLQAGMAPMVSATLLATEHGLDERVANTSLAIGVLISLATIPAINALL